MAKFHVTMISDNVCPWCYVGKKRLEKGIQLYTEKHPGESATFTFEQRPFYLDPSAPKQGISKLEAYDQKFGPERRQAAWQRLSGVGSDEGIRFNWEGKTGNTKDSHRLVALAKTKSEAVQKQVIDAVLQGYFEDAQDITSHDALVRAGVAGGLDAAEVRAMLASEAYGDEVDQQAREARQQGVSGVPHFIINDAFEFSGGQEPAVFVQLFERLQQKGLA